MRELLTLTLVFLVSLAYAQTNIKESYEVKFYPSFHNDLEIKLDVYSNSQAKLSLKQNSQVLVHDSICNDGNCQYYLTGINRYKEALALQKPNFVFEMDLDEENIKKYTALMESIKQSCSPKTDDLLFGTDGITIDYIHRLDGEKIECEFWSPSANSKVGKTFMALLESLEKNPNGIVERTAENIKWYFDESSFNLKLVNSNPLYVKILDLPYSCSETLRSFIDTLPASDVIFLDFTNYRGRDTSCFSTEFEKKYKRIRWIVDANDWQKYRELFGKKNK